MNMLKISDFEEIKCWMYRNARPLDLARYQYHFEHGSAENVLSALVAFQNEDGGFGHALDSDNWNPNSTPYNIGLAIETFRELEIYNPHHPIIEKAFLFLDSGMYFTEKGWAFSVPTNNDYPHAPWLGYNEASNDQNEYMTTGNLVGYILRCADKDSSLYQKALSLTDDMIGTLRQLETLEEHQVGAFCTLLKDILCANLTDRFDSVYLSERLCEMVNASIERDPAKWPFYSMRPSQYIDSQQSIFYHGNEQIVDKEMDYILSTRHAGGVWDISWKWSEYPKEFAISERWWQGYWAIRNLMNLKSFGRLSYD